MIFVLIGCQNMIFKNFHLEFLKLLVENALFVNACFTVGLRE